MPEHDIRKLFLVKNKIFPTNGIKHVSGQPKFPQNRLGCQRVKKHLVVIFDYTMFYLKFID